MIYPLDGQESLRRLVKWCQITEATVIISGGPNTKMKRNKSEIKFSPEDVDLSSLSWHVMTIQGYAVRWSPMVKGKRKFIKAHRLVLARILGRELTPADVTDHINGDRLDNRRDNIRLTTKLGNAQNKDHHPYRGTVFHKETGKWVSQVSVKNKTTYLGIFSTREEAAECSRKKREELGFLTNVT